jgi:hypothetical protein
MMAHINNLNMHKVTIKKSGFYFSFWDESQADWIEKNILDASLPISWYLNYPIQFTEILTVREIVNLIEPHADVLGLVMINDLAGIDIDKIVDLAKADKLDKNETEIESICLVRIAESVRTQQGDEEFNFLSTYPVLVGLTSSVEEDDDEDNTVSLSSLDFLSWCDFPFEIDDFVEYINPETEDVVFDGVMNWTLGEILSTILSQSSISIQVSQSVSIDSIEPSDPVEMSDVFQWLDDLDRIFLK